MAQSSLVAMLDPYHKKSLYSNENSSDSKHLFVILTCVYIITWYLQLGDRIEFLKVIRFEFVLGLFLTVAAIFKYCSNKCKPSQLRAPILAWMILLGLYTIFSYDIEKSWDIYFNRVIKFSMLALFISVFVQTERALKLVVAAFLLAMLKLGQEGVFGWLSGGLVWQNQGIMRLHGSTLLYRHPNSFSGMAVGCLPFIFYLYPVVSKYYKLALIALFASSIIIILFTGSRTGYVATCLLGIYFWRRQLLQSPGRTVIGSLIVGVLVITFTPDQYVDRFVSIFTMEEVEGASASTRLQIIEDAVDVFFEHPLGVGVAAFPAVRMEMFGRYQDTHNLYLELLTNLSLIGLVCFFWFVFSIVRLNKQIVCGEPKTTTVFQKALGSAVIGFIYARLFLGMFGMDTYEIYWWFAAGLTMANLRLQKLSS